ncbi:PRC-barrel domain-containing protein [Propylenella binzhouense]|uniref:PRC-barrel domain containing protein n=1 Tax=Propylenella binzhouense TaxID=2555902 RepID=A0A964T651_9HYPH|nr:PRC-barrel domain-containing protein [Propylenella binzhouense]MYZ49223.1 hypothetical protein [Propylenella binzhouense]
MRYPASALLLAALLAQPAGAQPAGPGGVADKVAAVQRGLAGLLDRAGEALHANDRFAATEALNEARHLGYFATHAWGVRGQARDAFRGADESVREARHLLQNGRPEAAADTLLAAASSLGRERLDRTAQDPSPPTAPELREMAGRTVLSADGKGLGEVSGVAGGDGGLALMVGSGGMLGFGEETWTVPAEAVLLGERYVVVVGGGPAS